MSAERFEIVDVNPNDAVGGGGCLCSEDNNPDCKGPYAVFYVQDMASNISPVPVIGAACLKAACAKLDGESLKGGEADPPTIEGEFTELPDAPAQTMAEVSESLKEPMEEAARAVLTGGNIPEEEVPEV